MSCTSLCIAMVRILGVAEGGDERANLLCAWLANPQSDKDRRIDGI
jgi:hypothetical protein